MEEQLLAEGHPPLWGLSASRRAAFRGHGPVLAGAEQPSASLGAMASEAARRPPPPPSPPARWFDGQVVDHFVPATERTPHWSQRFYVNDTLWGGPGFPVFMYIGGESAESGHALSGELFMSHLAEQHQALMVDVEHRFYGASHPTKDMGDESIALLSSQQALADLAHFVAWFSKTFGSGGTGDSPWVCFGGSYPGDLSAWFRLKYPHLVVGAVASSAPVLAVQDMPSYMDVVGRSLRRDGGDRCWEKVANATAALANMLALGPSGEEAAMRHFGTCEPMTALNAATFVGDAMGTLQGVVQGNHIYPGGNMTTISIMCGQIEKANTTLDALLPLSTPPKNGTHCRDNSYAKAIAQLRNATWGSSMDRQWTWQTCNEFDFSSLRARRSRPSTRSIPRSPSTTTCNSARTPTSCRIPSPPSPPTSQMCAISRTRPPGALMASRARTVVLRGARAGRLACSPAGRLGGPVALARAGRAPDAAPAGPQPDAGLHRRCALAARGPGYGCSRGADRVATRQAPRTAATCTTRTPPTCPRCRPRTPRSRRSSPRGCPRARVIDRCLAPAAGRGWLVG